MSADALIRIGIVLVPYIAALVAVGAALDRVAGESE